MTFYNIMYSLYDDKARVIHPGIVDMLISIAVPNHSQSTYSSGLDTRQLDILSQQHFTFSQTLLCRAMTQGLVRLIE